jgi:hypothetical protein
VARQRIFALMPKAWKILAQIPRSTGDEPPKREYFLVAMKDQSAALATLQFRRPDLENAEFLIRGEAAPDLVEWLDVKDGQILSIMVVA